jgi:hypothetical protein
MKSKCIAALLLTFACFMMAPEITYGERTEVAAGENLENVEAFLEKQVPGVDASYQKVIDVLIAQGWDVYIRGGAMRDLLSSNPSEPKDIDFDYSGTVEELKAILDAMQWRYTQLPGRSTIIIGDHRGAHMEAVPFSVAFDYGESLLEFTINNIFYDCKRKQLVPGTEIGLTDLFYNRLHILTSNLNAWLYRKGRHPYERIFRSWNMVGKGFVYTTDFANFIHRETVKKLHRYPDLFKEEMLHYLGSHFESFDDVYYGAIAVMGYDWAQEKVLSLRTEAEARSLAGQELRDQFTYFR